MKQNTEIENTAVTTDSPIIGQAEPSEPTDPKPTWDDICDRLAGPPFTDDPNEVQVLAELAAAVQAHAFVGELPEACKLRLEKNPHFLRYLNLANFLPDEPEELNDQTKPAPKPVLNPSETRPKPAPIEGEISHAKTDSDSPSPSDPSKNSNPTRPTRAPSRGPVSLLNHLPTETQDQILDLLDNDSYTEVQDSIAAPFPKGFAITVSIAALKRFHKVHRIRREAEHLKSMLDSARALLESTETADDLSTAANHLIKMRLLETASTSSGLSLPHLYQLARMLHHQRMADLAERRLALAEKKSKP